MCTDTLSLRPCLLSTCVTVHLCSAAEEEAAKAAAAEAKKTREAEKKVIKKQRQLLRAIAEGGPGQQRLLSEGEKTTTTRPRYGHRHRHRCAYVARSCTQLPTTLLPCTSSLHAGKSACRVCMAVMAYPLMTHTLMTYTLMTHTLMKEHGCRLQQCQDRQF